MKLYLSEFKENQASSRRLWKSARRHLFIFIYERAPKSGFPHTLKANMINKHSSIGWRRLAFTDCRTADSVIMCVRAWFIPGENVWHNYTNCMTVGGTTEREVLVSTAYQEVTIGSDFPRGGRMIIWNFISV